MNKLSLLKRPFFILAPMDDVTDTVFRQIIGDCAAPDMYFTEFTNVDGLQSPGRESVKKKLLHSKKESPLIAQIWGLKPENYELTAKQIVNKEFGVFAAIDINMGCPVKEVVRNGACSALINNRELAAEIIQATKKGANNKLPISVKTRLGFNEIDYSWHKFLLEQGIDILIVHGRTRSQMSKVPADWEAIGEIRKLRDKIAPNTLIVGNGDVDSYAQGLELANKYKLDGIMIGRGVFNDPFVFSETSPWPTSTEKQKVAIFRKHIELFEKTWEGKQPVRVLNKFCKIYINNFEGAKEQREKLMSAKSTEELLSMLPK